MADAASLLLFAVRREHGSREPRSDERGFGGVFGVGGGGSAVIGEFCVEFFAFLSRYSRCLLQVIEEADA
jgi:hypothetical protein